MVGIFNSWSINKSHTLKFLVGVLVLAIYFSCSQDDGDDFVVAELRDRGEQQATDDALLRDYFETHYYNAGDLQSIANLTINDVVIEAVPDTGLPTGGRLLIDELNDSAGILEEHTVNLFDTDYTFYILRLRQGTGTITPNSGDDVRVRYEGFLEDASVFDDANKDIPQDFDLINLIPAWRLVVPQFNIAEGFTTNNGIVNYTNPGVGIMFIPSGLGFFNTFQTGIPSYSNIIFKFELLQSNQKDHDNDGVPSYIEELNQNILYTDDDSDSDGFPNYVDPDDDGDGVSTIDEHAQQQYMIGISDPDPVFGANEFVIGRTTLGSTVTITTITLVDSNGDGTFDYLDSSIAVDNNTEN